VAQQEYQASESMRQESEQLAAGFLVLYFADFAARNFVADFAAVAAAEVVAEVPVAAAAAEVVAEVPVAAA